MRPTTTHHTWIIDSLADDVARVEEDGERTITVPRSLLPEGAREGQALAVERQGRGADAVVVRVTIDHEATRRALSESREQTSRIAKASRRRDGGGDVAL